MEEVEKLSAHQCVLLAAKYAAESNIKALRALTAAREADLEFGLILRLLLTFLPETLDPAQYTPYLDELVAGPRTLGEDFPHLDTTPIDALTAAEARRRARKLHVLLQPLAHPLYESETELSPFTHFLINRSHRIDAETGVLEFIPQLVAPFLYHDDYLRTWFISVVLPLLRLGYEYYPDVPAPPLDDFALWTGKRAIDTLLSNLRQRHTSDPDLRQPARDLRGVVGPWLCGADARKRRFAQADTRISSEVHEPDDWECLYQWLADTSKHDFHLAVSAFTEWDGPDDLDLGGFDGVAEFLDEDNRGQLEQRYAQTALASLYLVENGSSRTLETALSLLTRLCNLLSLDLPAAIDVPAESLPSLDNSGLPIASDTSAHILQEDDLLRVDNAITRPQQDTIKLLEMFIFSALTLSSLQHTISTRDVARMYLRKDRAEQFSLLKKLLNNVSGSAKKTPEEWASIRIQILWLWGWGEKPTANNSQGNGPLGQLAYNTVELEILRSLIEIGHYHLAIQLYLQSSTKQNTLSQPEIENVVLTTAMHFYDNASNGNRTRGGVKKASDIITAFAGHFRSSPRVQRTQYLLAATHALSFYSLTLQHGVPFQPVNLRVTAEPLVLLRKVLLQNRGSYTHLDDLVSIGQNLVISMPATIMDEDQKISDIDPAVIEKKKQAAERRVIGMAIEAALEEDDFETAYSYVVNRLSLHSASPSISPAASNSSRRFSFGSAVSDHGDDDAQDVAWRAALQAGRYQSSSASSSTSWSNPAGRPDLRRLEQRMELLSQALILAPPSRLEEVLAVWQRCEAEMNGLLAHETAAEERFNDMADRKVPGAFSNEPVLTVQPRREVGRGAVEESPMGLFDVARGAAAAFSKSAFPLRGQGSASQQPDRDMTSSTISFNSTSASDSESFVEGDDGDRVRKRDVVANAVTGGLASGIGWVLGAKPVNER